MSLHLLIGDNLIQWLTVKCEKRWEARSKKRIWFCECYPYVLDNHGYLIHFKNLCKTVSSGFSFVKHTPFIDQRSIYSYLLCWETAYCLFWQHSLLRELFWQSMCSTPSISTDGFRQAFNPRKQVYRGSCQWCTTYELLKINVRQSYYYLRNDRKLTWKQGRRGQDTSRLL